ncbi:uncharacterized protein [Erythrolamprus reginae]|uniref:uncharacterized protein n=1 Tax=Erythrolamprus reginae TaxID=121349 RepID=UPI00396C9592
MSAAFKPNLAKGGQQKTSTPKYPRQKPFKKDDTRKSPDVQSVKPGETDTPPYPTQPKGAHKKGSRGKSSGAAKSTPKDSKDEKPTYVGIIHLSTVSEKSPLYDIRELWTLDSGAAAHIACRKESFSELHPTDVKEVYGVGDLRSKVEGKGKVFVKELDSLISNVFYVPTAKNNILSGYCLREELKVVINYELVDTNIIKDGKLLATAIPIKGVFYLQPKPASKGGVSISVPKGVSTGPERNPGATASSKAPKANETPEVPNAIANVKHVLTNKSFHSRCIHRWHRRLGHASYPVLAKMSEYADGFKIDGACKVYLDCKICNSAKSRHSPVPKIAVRLCTRIFELVHTDVVGPFRPTVGKLFGKTRCYQFLLWRIMFQLHSLLKLNLLELVHGTFTSGIKIPERR